MQSDYEEKMLCSFDIFLVLVMVKCDNMIVGRKDELCVNVRSCIESENTMNFV